MKRHIRKLKNKAHLALAITANSINLYPSRGMTVIGVTGTDGKTTTSNLIYSILRKNNTKVALISTIGAKIDGKNYETGLHVTTPSPFVVQKYIKLAKKMGCTHLILEVTSHALDQNRTHGIKFDYGVLTNITHEHLDYHANYENYVITKLKLLKISKKAIVNSNGEWFDYVKKEIGKDKISTYSLYGKDDDLTLLNLPFKLTTKLIGDFNLENILASILVTQKLGVDEKIIDAAIKEFEAPIGRQEVLRDDPLIMVDFAHTPNSFEKILPTLRSQTKGRLIHVFGSAGERDRGKRIEMGKAASFYDDVIILTAEDPRGERVVEINSEIKKGILNGKKIYEIEDRREAITFAIEIAKKEDTVVVTGKGHEKSMNLGDGEIPWSDQEEIIKILK